VVVANENAKSPERRLYKIMNWYKLSNLYQPNLFSEETMDSMLTYSGNFEEDIEEAKTLEEIEKIIDHYGFQRDRIMFNNGTNIVVVFIENNEKQRFSNFSAYKTYVIENPPYATMKEAQEWIDDIPDMYLHEFAGNGNDEIDKWDQINLNQKVYHGTYKEKVDDILKNGLQAKNESRGISNRSMGSAVFTSSDPETAYNSYPYVFEINIGQMKADGYMPRISGETPLEDSELRSAIAHKIGFEEYMPDEYTSEGYDYETIAIYGNIPKKYIRLLEE